MKKMLEGLVKDMKEFWKAVYQPLASDVLNPQLPSPTSYQSLLVSRIKGNPALFSDYKGYLDKNDIDEIQTYRNTNKGE